MINVTKRYQNLKDGLIRDIKPILTLRSVCPPV